VISLRIGRRGALAMAAAVAFVASVGGVAWAYWTAQAAGVATYSNADSVGTGNQPAATVTGTSVSLSWPASTTTAAGRAVGGYLVNRYPAASGGTATGAAQGSCAAVPVTALTCTETGVPAGTWYYTVTPVLSAWRGTESPRSTGAMVGVQTFTLSWPAGTTALTAGSGTTLTITARTGEQTDTGYTGAHTLTFAGPGTAPNGAAPSYNNGNASVTFTAGVATVPVTLVKAETVTLTVTAGPVTGSIAVTINHGAATQFLVPTPSSATAGTALPITLTAVDAYSNTATGYAGQKTLTWSGPGTAPDGHAPGYPANPVTFSSGVAANLPVTLYRAESTMLTAGAATVTGTSGTFTVLATSFTRLAIATPGSQTAGTAFTATLTALDAYQNPVAAGTQTLSWAGSPGSSPSEAQPSYPATATFSAAGTATVPITLVKAEAAVLRVAVGTITASSGTFTVSPAAAARLAWSHVTVSSSSATIGSPCLFTCAVAKLDTGQTFTANISVTDTYGNTVNAIGSGHTVTVSADSASFIAPASGTSVTLTISATGPAESTQQLTFRVPNKSTSTLTASTSAGPAYPNATATISKN
jgi:hypothetical protein